MPCKAQDIYYLVFYRKWLSTPILGHSREQEAGSLHIFTTWRGQRKGSRMQNITLWQGQAYLILMCFALLHFRYFFFKQMGGLWEPWIKQVY